MRVEIAAAPLPADIALWRFGRCFSHGAIVIGWPIVIHAYAGKGCILEDASRARWLSQIGERGSAQPRPVKFFSIETLDLAMQSRRANSSASASCEA